MSDASGAIAPIRPVHYAQRLTGSRWLETMWEKVKVIWKIPELRTKIGLTLLMLAIYRVGFQIQVPILDQAKVNSARQPKGRRRRHARSGRHAQRQPAARRDDLRPGHHALHLGLDHFPAAGERVSTARAAAEGGRSGSKENQRIHALRDVLPLLIPKLVLHTVVRPGSGISGARVFKFRGRPRLALENSHRSHDDRRHHVPHVARRADR